MLSVLAQPHVFPSTSDNGKHRLELNEPGNLEDAVASFTNMIVGSGHAVVRLYCSVPTWSSATDTCLDLHDLHELKSKALLCVHDSLQSLRSSGVSASYSLAPLSSSLSVVSQRPISLELLKKAQISSGQLKRGKTVVVNIDGAPCLVLA
ncbi:hypothetical protein CPB83DRAFT_857891 [Crepidotus variabilis]|uniref:Uncharacterized protein n=1 Tax=Crepidotus variabilis TaxID=179855 RepID=A0A9P6ECF4_9AGAR|nr:hypothetical protein CPB83DRAFT_857891 [Crepidotus variabilis]